MQVKKSTLKLATIVVVATIVASSIFSHVYYKERKERQRIEEFEAAIMSMIDKKYKELLWDYKYEVKMALDYDYSPSTRDRAVGKINKLFGYQFYDREGSESFATQHRRKNDQALVELRSKAAEVVRNELLKQ